MYLLEPQLLLKQNKTKLAKCDGYANPTITKLVDTEYNKNFKLLFLSSDELTDEEENAL